MLTEFEKKIISSIQSDLPITPRPYLEIAEQLGITEETLMQTLQRFHDEGIIRRFGATIRHQISGFEANAMGAWKVEEDRIDEVGEIMAAFKEVSHCYRRRTAPGWPYNLYTMIHAGDEGSCREIARRLSEKTGVDTYQLLFSLKELKKTSMRYFPKDDED
jgi:DNA-binding Lrp family transcriptional regulator